MTVLRLGEVTSTQDVAKQLAADGAEHGTVVRAERQTAGRGRLGRRWASAPGDGLLFSIVLRPGGLLRDAPLLTLGAAAGLALALDVQVKWPNDLVVDAGPERPPLKLGGILGELEAEPGGAVRHVVLGVGLNVLQRAFPEELPWATSLWIQRGVRHPARSVEVDREEVFERAVAAILEWQGHAERLNLWRSRAHTLGRRVEITTGEGDDRSTVAGLATGLADDGALIVDGRPVYVGEVGASQGAASG
ncbi:MAG: biotin--[acetyl-CoA-carboxylase] ligase [Myxococcales bacterium]|nr:biotin--[acetyl-CoA-carboxylase] ligase [Myxococcales bacterium]